MLVPIQGQLVPSAGFVPAERAAPASQDSDGRTGGSVLKSNADEIALPPDHAAFANGVKIVEGQFEIQRQQIEVVEFNAGPGIRYVLNAAGENAALRIEEQQRVFRNHRPCDGSAFDVHARLPPVHAWAGQAAAWRIAYRRQSGSV
ncbi:hypothetical protein [Bradyrhizobium jicamae]|uniref:hypothetical protein n=1 Tax=Bradyrhizobium jicamae TaxID=280332 RepID=UPI0012EDF4D9|nr:hypothetical protein [Bradyrhizobium jicamae]